MTRRRTLERIKAFGMTNQIVMEELTRVQKEHSLDLGHLPPAVPEKDPEYYPQFDASIRSEAAAMSKHYEVFYSLEKSIRVLVSGALEAAEGTDEWWSTTRVPEAIKLEVASRIKKEVQAGVTRRSSDQLDYTTFGELSTLIESNWDVFGSIFDNKEAVKKVVATLNTLRNPIAHCSLLAEDEQLRLRLAVRDWFRQME
jgi:hypothetical protein